MNVIGHSKHKYEQIYSIVLTVVGNNVTNMLKQLTQKYLNLKTKNFQRTYILRN